MKRNRLILGCILLLALGLRIYQIGQDSFWFDEAGVAEAAGASTITETLQAAQSHVAAMPFNYLQTWLLMRFGNSDEGWLRFPSAIWSTLAVLALYGLVRRLADEKTALIAAAFFAVHPFAIQYAQELRFYASGAFFYLLGTLLFLRAEQENRWPDWLLAAAVVVWGAYDFPYTVFAWMNAAVFWAAMPVLRTRARAYRLALAGGAIALLVLPGLLWAGSDGTLGYTPSVLMALRSLSIGLGWIPMMYSVADGPRWLGVLLFLLFGVGLVFCVRSKKRAILALLLSAGGQIGLILGADAILGYIIPPRQFLPFLPLMLIPGASALAALMDLAGPPGAKKAAPAPASGEQFRKLNRGLALACVAVILCSAVPAVQNYYLASKSYAREVSAVLKDRLTPADRVICMPWYEPALFRYYFNRQQVPFAEGQMLGLDFKDLQNAELGSGSIYLITRDELTEEQKQFILDLGFVVLWERPGFDPGAHRLYLRPAL